jgi:hypothetical protein
MKNFKLRRTAAIIGYTVLAVVLFSSCEMDKTKLSGMKPPVVIIGINKDGGSVAVKDGDGNVEVFTDSGIQSALSHSRSVGDTIK